MQALNLSLRSGSFTSDQADAMWSALGTLQELEALEVNTESWLVENSDSEGEEFVELESPPEPNLFRGLSLLTRVT